MIFSFYKEEFLTEVIQETLKFIPNEKVKTFLGGEKIFDFSP